MSFAKSLLVSFVYIVAFASFILGCFVNAGGDTGYATYLTSIAVFNLICAIHTERSWSRWN